MYKYIPIVVAGFLLGCSSTPVDERKPRGIAAFADDPRLGEAVKKICFKRNIDGFSEAKTRTVVLERAVNDDYIVEVSGACPSLRNAQSIGLKSYTSCVTPGDYLLVSESAFSLDDGTGQGPDRCYIDKIYKWDKKAKVEAEDAMGDSEG